MFHRSFALVFVLSIGALVSGVVGCGEPAGVLPATSAAAPAAAIAPAPSEGIAPKNAVQENAAHGQDWPSFLGGNRDSRSSETGIITDWSSPNFRLVWQRKLGTSYGIGSVSEGKYYQFDRFGDEAKLTCLDARTGEQAWEFSYPTTYADLYGYAGGPRCSPVIDDGRVYLLGAEGMLHCLATADGSLIWKVDTIDKFGVIQNFFGVGATPVVEGDLLIAMIGGSPPEDQQLPPGQLDRASGNGSGVVAFNKKTGEVIYKISQELASYSSPKLASIDGRRWCFVFARGGLLAFHPETGVIDFEFPWRAPILESVNASTPVVVGNEVFISETYGPGSALLAVKPGGYEIVWQDDQRRRERSMQTHWNTPIYQDGYLYGSSGRHERNAELRCIEWKTGKVMWSVPGLTRSSLLYVDGHFVCLSEDGVLRLLKVNPQKYEVVTEITLKKETAGDSAFGLGPARLLKAPAWAAPILSHGLLYVRGADRLVCLELIPAK